MIKLVKFNLLVDNKRCRSLEDLQNNFNLFDVLEHFERGKLEKWLKTRKYEEHYQQIRTLKEERKTTIQTAQKICEIFNIAVESDVLENEVEIFDFFQNITKKNKQDVAIIKLKQEKHELTRFLQNFYELYTQQLQIQQLKKEETRVYEDKQHHEIFLLNSTEPLCWDEANRYVKKLNASLYLGYTSWSIPTQKQLKRFTEHNKYIESHKYYFWTEDHKKFDKQSNTTQSVAQESNEKISLRLVCKTNQDDFLQQMEKVEKILQEKNDE